MIDPQDLAANLHVSVIALISIGFGVVAIWAIWHVIKFIGNLFGFTKKEEPKLKNANELR